MEIWFEFGINNFSVLNTTKLYNIQIAKNFQERRKVSEEYGKKSTHRQIVDRVCFVVRAAASSVAIIDHSMKIQQ